MWKLSGEHVGNRCPNDLIAPRTWLISAVRDATAASRARFTAKSAWCSTERCVTDEKQLRIDAPKTREQLGVRAVVLALVARDQLHPTRVGDDHFHPGRLRQTADPGRLPTDFQDQARRPEAQEERRQLRGRHRDAALLERPTTSVEHTEVGVAVAQIEPDRDRGR